MQIARWKCGLKSPADTMVTDAYRALITRAEKLRTHYRCKSRVEYAGWKAPKMRWLQMHTARWLRGLKSSAASKNMATTAHKNVDELCPTMDKNVVFRTILTYEHGHHGPQQCWWIMSLHGQKTWFLEQYWLMNMATMAHNNVDELCPYMDHKIVQHGQHGPQNCLWIMSLPGPKMCVFF